MKNKKETMDANNNPCPTTDEQRLIEILKRLKQLIGDSEEKSNNVDDDTIVFPDCELYDDLPF